MLDFCVQLPYCLPFQYWKSVLRLLTVPIVILEYNLQCQSQTTTLRLPYLLFWCHTSVLWLPLQHTIWCYTSDLRLPLQSTILVLDFYISGTLSTFWH